MRAASTTTGFTLLELLVALAVAAIIATLGVPSFIDMIKNHRQSVRANGLLTAVYLARSEAVKRNRETRLCGSSDGSSCDGKWSVGWIVYQDANGNAKPDAGEVVRVFRAESGATITASTDPVIFRADGSVTAASQFAVCDDRGTAHAKAVCIESAGSAHVDGKGCFGGNVTCP